MDNISQDMFVFCRIAETGSFAAAAAELGMTPSAVSKLMTRLETRLGTRLLTRTTRRLSLTVEGETYLRHALEITAAIENAEADVMASAKEPSGTLRVNTGAAFGRHVLAPLLPEFMERYPKIKIDLSITDRQVDLIGEKVDVAIRMGALGDSSLIARKIGESGRAVCASPAYLKKCGIPKSGADLVNHNCLLVAGFTNLRQWPFATPEGINLQEVSGNFISDNADLVLNMMLRGLGIGRLARFIFARHLESGELVEILQDTHQTDPVPMHAVMPPGGNRTPKVRAFVDFLVNHPGVRSQL